MTTVAQRPTIAPGGVDRGGLSADEAQLSLGATAILSAAR